MSPQKHDTTEKMDNCLNKHSHCAHVGSPRFGEAGKKILMTLLGILLVYAIIFLGTSIKNNIRKFSRIGWADKFERSINIAADGKAVASPDIAKLEMGTLTSAKTVMEAQKKNTETMNDLLAKLKDLGIDKKDIQTTNYTVNPQYNYTEAEGSVLIGYEVNNTIRVKVRDLTKTGEVLSLAGQVGANTTGGLQFEVDDLEVYRKEARADAMKKIAEKADLISKALGVRFTDVISYSEYDNSQGPNYAMYENRALGMGGAAPQPSIETGTKDIILNVNVTFEIK